MPENVEEADDKWDRVEAVSGRRLRRRMFAVEYGRSLNGAQYPGLTFRVPSPVHGSGKGHFVQFPDAPAPETDASSTDGRRGPPSQR